MNRFFRIERTRDPVSRDTWRLLENEANAVGNSVGNSVEIQAWTFDHLSTDNYTYSLLDRQVPARFIPREATERISEYFTQ